MNISIRLYGVKYTDRLSCKSIIAESYAHRLFFDRSVRQTASAIGLTVILASCVSVSHPDYPAQWPTLKAPVSHCPDLAGQYLSNAETSPLGLSTKAGPIYLQELFGFEKTGRVEIVQPSDKKLVVAIRDNGTLLYQVSYSQKRGEFDCDRAGFLEMDQRTSYSSYGPAESLVKSKLYLARSSDGSLVVRIGKRELGTSFFVIPVYYGNKWIWLRFRPHESN
jgi:hypothetical protein